MPRTNVPPAPCSLNPVESSPRVTGRMSNAPVLGARMLASKHSVAAVEETTEAEMTSGDAVWMGDAPPWTVAEAVPGAAKKAAASIAPARRVARRPGKRLLTGWGTVRHDLRAARTKRKPGTAGRRPYMCP